MTRQEIARAIALACMERYNAMSKEYGKGKKRDQFALDYFAGAYKALILIGQTELAEAIANELVYGIALHGFKAIEELVV